MPPPHFGVEALRVGGIPAALGAVIAAVLSWPTSHLKLVGGVLVKSYHSGLNGSSLSQSDAIMAMLACVIVGAVIGMLVGAILVLLGVTTSKQLHIEE